VTAGVSTTMWSQDIRYALRVLRRSPGFAATAILTLAVSIGANAAIWSAVKGILVAPLPYEDPGRLVRLFEESPSNPHFPFAPADFRDYRAELRTFDGLAAYGRADLGLGDAQPPEQLRGMRVSAGFFTLLGRPPALGRDIRQEDEIEGGGDVVILSHSLWMRRFQGDPAAVGRTVRLSGRPFRIVGVLPRGFQHVGGTFQTYGHGEPVDVWWAMPVPRDEKPGARYSHFYNVVGRVKRDASRAAMEDDLRRAGVSAATRYPEPGSRWKPKAVPLRDEIVGTAGSTLGVLAGAALAVLMLACVNVAGLLLGRAVQRSGEISVRAALGATRWRLARQLLVESLVLAGAGGALGVALAHGAVWAVRRFGPADMPRLQMIALDGQVLGLALGATMLSAMLFGLAPALRLARTSAGEALKEGGRTIAGVAHQRTRRALAAAEVALAFVLVVSSGLLLRSFVSMVTADPGFQPQGAITASVELPTVLYDKDASREFFRRAAERVGALPGVRAVAFTSDVPWSNYDENTGFDIVGWQSPDGEGPQARYHFLTSGYTRATGTPILAGRDIGASDGDGAPLVVLMNAAAARKYWGSPAAAVGARVNLWGKERTVAGVLGDVKDMPWHDRAVPALYFPQPQMWYPQRMFLVARYDAGLGSAAEAIRRAVAEIDPQLPLANVRPLESVASAATATRRLTLWLVAAFGLTSFFLAVVGIYGVMAQAVGQRRQEFGVRQALGATPRDIMRHVFSSGAGMTIAGLALGVVLALGSTRLLASLLYGVTAADPATFAAVSAVLLGAAAAAIYFPARRATRVNPAVALRGD
jgi:macrolide transport system ATP-binding/permease protein